MLPLTLCNLFRSSLSKISPPFLSEWPKRLELARLWIWSPCHGQILNLRRQCNDLSLDVRKLGCCVLHMEVQHGKHLIHSLKKAIESVWSSCWCKRGWLCWGLWSIIKSINLLLSITPLVLNSIPWYRMYSSFGALDVSYAPIDCVITNGIVPLNYCQTTREFEPCFCN